MLVASTTEPTEEDVLSDVFTSDVISGEWRHRPITSSLLAAPDRVRFLVGRFGPFGALPTAAQGLDPENVGMPEDVDLQAAGVAVLLLLAWIGAAFAGGAALLRYRNLE